MYQGVNGSLVGLGLAPATVPIRTAGLATRQAPQRHAGERQRLVRRLRRLRADYHALYHRHEGLLREMRLAERVQRGLLPTAFPTVPGVRMTAGYQPLWHMAGDFYNAFRLDHARIGFYVGDVMGHGPASALLSVMAMQGLRAKRIQSNAYEIRGPAAVLRELSAMLMEAELPNEPFLTMAYGVLDVHRRTLRYCAGGHPPPIVLRRGRPSERLEVNGPLLGAIDLPFAESEYQLRPGDRLVLYSDGAQAARWGEAGVGIDALCERLTPGRPTTLGNQLHGAMAAMTFDSEDEGDDVTVLVVEMDG